MRSIWQEPVRQILSRGLWLTGLLILGTAIVTKQFVGETSLLGLLAQFGALMLGVGIAAELVTHGGGQTPYKVAAGLAFLTMLLLGWVNGAVGILGADSDPVNRMYWGVILVAAIGALISRLHAAGMARTMYATAISHVLVAAVGTSGRLTMPLSALIESVAINGFFVVLFYASARLFSIAARTNAQDFAA